MHIKGSPFRVEVSEKKDIEEEPEEPTDKVRLKRLRKIVLSRSRMASKVSVKLRLTCSVKSQRGKGGLRLCN